MTSLRLALRQLRNDPRFATAFVACLALGLAGFVALDAFEDAVSGELRARSQAWLGGDLVVESRRPLSAEEIAGFDAQAGPGAEIASRVELFSMAAAGGRARLVELCAIDDAYPLYGEIALEGLGAAGPTERRALREERGLWADPALLRALGAGAGDEIALGSASFRVQGAIARDTGRAASSFSLAPRVYVAQGSLPGTGLVATGSRIEYRRLYRLASGDADTVAHAMRLARSDPQIEVRAHGEAAGELSRAWGRVTDALSLVSLAAVFLACVGAAHLFRAHLLRRQGDVAILLALGATRRRAEQIFLQELTLLGVAAGLLASGLGALLLPLCARLAQDTLPAGFSPRVGASAIAVATALATAAGIASCLSLLARLRALRPAQLFAEAPAPALGVARPLAALAWSPAALLFVGVCLWRAPGVAAGVWFAGLFAGALALLAAIGAGALRAAAWPSPRWLELRLALRELARGGAGALSCFAALSLCVLLQGLAPQLRASLARDLEAPGESGLPSLFLFDIQPEQREALAAHVAEHGARLTRVSPLVRARLTSLRGEPVRDRDDGEAPAARARLARDDDEDGRRLRTRGYNLSYRDELAPGERLLAGRPFSPGGARGDGPAEISLEQSFAERLGVGLGDALGFDVQGVPVEGRVVSLREVRWQSFEPNFFVLFQSGVLEDAPQTFLASVPTLPESEREALQASLADAFPNVSSVDVTRTVERLLTLASRLEWALRGTSLLSLAVGLAVVFAIARDRARARRLETNLLKVLGADFRRVRRAQDLEYGLLGLCAALAGTAVCAVASASLARGVLGVAWTPDPAPLWTGALGVPLACVAAARLASGAVLRERPLALLQLPAR